MKISVILASLTLAVLMSGCSNGTESKSFVDMEDGQEGVVAQEVNGQADADNVQEVEQEFNVRNPDLDPSKFTMDQIQEIETTEDQILMLNWETGNLSNYSGKWLYVMNVVVSTKSDSEPYIATNSNQRYYFHDMDTYWNALDAAENHYAINLIGYLSELPDDEGYELNNCVFVGNGNYIEDPGFYGGNVYGFDKGSDPTEYTEDTTSNDQFQVDPNEPIENQIMDGFVGAMQDAAENNPNVTQEQKDFAQAYGEAWKFVESMQRFGY